MRIPWGEAAISIGQLAEINCKPAGVARRLPKNTANESGRTEITVADNQEYQKK